ncbi:hypothetical protein DSCO28_28210 [Desulfosarcina ovata subsp. sediminis]|uniref:Uncharacterized protein n=1 Tax=Desulfosarcina ovata subsp. sediminis TaxID=885957 RepID=A0A5K7ZNS3_9BACT|nr:hypothetical protein [Desulfosarcina ovata]BBO82255.1 hypothetical protein DSCO28_28210 [Desulfosarcina ovata subsp. sediminis]
MRLPGGLWHDGRRHREVGFRPLTGAVELAVSEALQTAETLPEATTMILQAALAYIGNLAPETPWVDALCVGDRQFLSVCLAGRLGEDEVWFTVECTACGQRFDFPLRFSALPVKPAGPTYPFCETDLASGAYRWRTPNGADQKILARFAPDDTAVATLLQRCLVREDTDAQGADAADLVDGLTAAEIDCIEAAMEAQAPEVTGQVQATCTGCGRVNVIDIDPLFHLKRLLRDVNVDIHRIASTYHWSEAEILSLPRQRRLRYLELIDRARGMAV